MTDRELLELAAKAAGIELWHEDVFTNGLTHKVSDNGVLCWNPLTDDGDALRLAVKLEMSADFFDDGIVVGYTAGDVFEQVTETPLTDPLDATRRAIVRAAAEIGRSMK